MRDQPGRFDQDLVVGLGIQLADVDELVLATGLLAFLPDIAEVVDKLAIDLLGEQLFSLTTTPLKTPETLTGGSSRRPGSWLGCSVQTTGVSIFKVREVIRFKLTRERPTGRTDLLRTGSKTTVEIVWVSDDRKVGKVEAQWKVVLLLFQISKS